MTAGNLPTAGRSPRAVDVSLEEGGAEEDQASPTEEVPEDELPACARRGSRASTDASSDWARVTSGSTTGSSGRSLEESFPTISISKMLGWFDACIGVVILANAVAIGVEQSLDLAGADISAFAVLEHVFLGTYVLELIVRGIATRGQCLSDNWVRFDVFLVGTGVTCYWIIGPIMGDLQAMESVSMLRLMRLLRLARAVRLISVFRELWMLVQGLLVSARTMVYTITLIAMILYLFSVVAVEVITKHNLARPESGDPAFRSIVDNSFSTLPQTMMTLMQFVSFDNVVLIYEPLVKRDWRLALFFVSIIVVVGILLMNLVTAVLVNSALEQALADKELAKKQEDDKRRKMWKQLRKLFRRLDVDASGHVNIDEIVQMSDEDRRMLANMMGVSDPMEVFHALDVDGSGEVDIDEFCNGLWEVSMSKAPIEVKRVEKMVQAMREQLRTSESVMASMVKDMGDLKYRFDETLRLLSLNASAASPGSLGGADGRQSATSATPGGPKGSRRPRRPQEARRAPPTEEVEADSDAHPGLLASGVQAGLKDQRLGGGAAVRCGLGAGAAARAARDAGPGSGQNADEVLSLGSDISTAAAWMKELMIELRSMRATLTLEASAGSKTQASVLQCGRCVTPHVLHELTKASRTSSKASCSSNNVGDSSSARWRTGAKAAEKAEGHGEDPHVTGTSTSSGARQPEAPARKAAPRRAEPEGSAPPTGETATSPLNCSSARAPEASPGGASAPAAAEAQPPPVASDGAPRAPARRALAKCLPAGPAEIHHL